jgi:serine phosphatase RsbU (regulator of sigma subunit)/anti-sigma regulatory factor (Ser/Thr protein kinase)
MREARAVIAGPSRRSAVELLAQAAAAMHGPSVPDEKLNWLVQSLRSLTDATLAAFVGVRGDGDVTTAVAGTVTYEVDRFARPALERLMPAAGSPLTLVGHDLRRDRRWLVFLERVGLPATAGSLGVTVLSEDGGPHGILVACHPDPTHFDDEDMAAATALGAHLGVALDNELRMTRLAELQEVQRSIVHQLQEAVRPPMPSVPATELGIHYLPADPSVPTGGDLHDWLVLPDGDVFLSVVDVMGKGVAATKEAVAVAHSLRMLILDGCPIEGLVARADGLLTAHNPDLVATVVVARYRPDDGRIWLAAGGHPPPLLIPAQGDIRFVSAPGVALGWPGAGSQEVVELQLSRNDTVVLYTDGLIESTKDVLAGLDNLIRAAAQVAQYPSAHVARALVERSLSGAMRRDDSLALVLRRRTPPPPDDQARLEAFEYRFSPSPATVPLGRHLLSDWLAHLSVDEAERADLLLVASELCSNAVRHASGAPSALSLRAWADGDAILIEVEDDGAGFELNRRYDDEIPDPDMEQGRGLYVVEALTDEMSVRREGERTIVRAVRRAALPLQ